ncbi:MAG: rhomboid family intramembrane serine protease [Actinomycetota bacterium]|nr:rhomboid family intramembrane serine protease [Actinomycetota bacterium]
MSATATQTCYRHPDRETGVSCSNCARPICTDCMTSTSVGMRCPECAKQRTQVRTVRDLTSAPELTYAIIGVNVLAFLASMATGGGLRAGGTVIREGALFGPAVADGELWRIVTGGFLHANLLHILFNMYFLWFLGQLLEPAVGKLRFGLLYVISLLGGSFGALLLSPDALTVGASGAVFGLLAAAILAARARGIDPLQSSLGMTLLLNLGITFLLPGISIGGHLGGLVAGGIAGFLLFEVGDRRSTARVPALVACVALGAVVAVGAVLVAAAAA